MALINSPIPNLFNGVSQQPAALRHPSQCEDQINAYPSIATGLRKRPPTRHIAKLTASSYATSYIHTINRDLAERYLVVITNGDLFVYDSAGVAKTVAFPDGKTYLTATTPRDEFAVVTIADYTFIANRNVLCAMDVTTSAGTVTGTKQEFVDLPTPTGTGNIYKIEGSPNNAFDNYYVKDTSPSNVWVEHIAPGITYKLNASTMPHILIRESDGTFTFKKATWNDRLVGDTTSNPEPSFIGRAIRDIFFYRNRLGFLCGESFVMSRVADYFNFWISTVTAALDDDPIDADVSHTKVSILKHAVPFSGSLMLFSDVTQFQLTAGDALTQRSVTADVVTEFESSGGARPVGIGTDLFFLTNRGQYSGVREYFVDTTSVSNDAADVTAHVPTYVPKNVFKIAPLSADDALFLLTLEERNAVYVYKYYWGDDEKLQSAWTKFLFDSGDTILNVDFVGPDAYFVIERSDGVYFEIMQAQANLADTGFDFAILLDRRTLLTGVYDGVNNWTTWTLPYADNGNIQIVLSNDFGTQRGALLTGTSRPSSTTVRMDGDYSGGQVFAGRQYSMRYTFSEFYYRDQRSGAVQTGRLQLTRMFIAYDATGYFRVEVTPKNRDPFTYRFTGKVLGDAALVLGSPTLHTGAFSFPIQSRNLGCKIEIINDSHLPSKIQSAEWEGDFVMQGQRV